SGAANHHPQETYCSLLPYKLPRAYCHQSKSKNDQCRCVVQKTLTFENRRCCTRDLYEPRDGTHTNSIRWGDNTSKQKSQGYCKAGDCLVRNDCHGQSSEEDDEESKASDDPPPFSHFFKRDGPAGFKQQGWQEDKKDQIGVNLHHRQSRDKAYSQSCQYQ